MVFVPASTRCLALCRCGKTSQWTAWLRRRHHAGSDATTGNTDALQFLSGVLTNQLWLRRVDNDLEVSITGSADKVTLPTVYWTALSAVITANWG